MLKDKRHQVQKEASYDGDLCHCQNLQNGKTKIDKIVPTKNKVGNLARLW